MATPSQLPTILSLKELKDLSIGKLAELAKELQVENPLALRKQELVFRVLQAQADLLDAHSFKLFRHLVKSARKHGNFITAMYGNARF